jgi:hypothetical protein
MAWRRVVLSGAVLGLVFALSFAAQKPPAASSLFIPLSDARPILEAFGDDLPGGLQRKSAEELAALWPGWVAQRDAAIRARLEQGDLDTIVHWMLFGTSFTRRARLTPENIQHLEMSGPAPPGAVSAGELLTGRLDDLLKALTSSTQDERVLLNH